MYLVALAKAGVREILPQPASPKMRSRESTAYVMILWDVLLRYHCRAVRLATERTAAKVPSAPS